MKEAEIIEKVNYEKFTSCIITSCSTYGFTLHFPSMQERLVHDTTQYAESTIEYDEVEEILSDEDGKEKVFPSEAAAKEYLQKINILNKLRISDGNFLVEIDALPLPKYPLVAGVNEKTRNTVTPLCKFPTQSEALNYAKKLVVEKDFIVKVLCPDGLLITIGQMKEGMLSLGD